MNYALKISFFPVQLFCCICASAQMFGTLERPFSADSPWNLRPVQPVLGAASVPRSDYFPLVGEGKWSTGVYLAKESDPGIDVLPPPGKAGVWDPDAEAQLPSVRMAYWPSNVEAAAGADGHADIVDPANGVIHSFFQLSQKDGHWQATQYAWTKLDGRGWGDPAHYFQGARAAGVPSMGGLIRKHEVRDNLPVYKHALAMSLTFNGLASKPAYVFPATSADASASTTNTGLISEGALLMLPPDFDAQRIANPQLRKVAETLKVYGGYVVDRNYGTPFVIYVENGSGFNLHASGWNGVVATELDRIRAALRPVLSSSGWLDANGLPIAIQQNLNLLSMRGPWRLLQGSQAGEFQTLEQAVIFPPTTDPISQVNWSGRNLSQVDWAKPVSGREYTLTVSSREEAKFRMQLQSADGRIVWDSGQLSNGQAITFAWPMAPVKVVLLAYSGTTGKSSSVGVSLLVASNSGPISK